jgi:hypothetical protein
MEALICKCKEHYQMPAFWHLRERHLPKKIKQLLESSEK